MWRSESRNTRSIQYISKETPLFMPFSNAWKHAGTHTRSTAIEFHLIECVSVCGFGINFKKAIKRLIVRISLIRCQLRLEWSFILPIRWYFHFGKILNVKTENKMLCAVSESHHHFYEAYVSAWLSGASVLSIAHWERGNAERNQEKGKQILWLLVIFMIALTIKSVQRNFIQWKLFKVCAFIGFVLEDV